MAMNDTEGQGVIEIRLESINQLFNSLDPFPFPERDLDTEAEEYIVGWARELPDECGISLVIRLPAGEKPRCNPADTKLSLNNYFSYRAEMAERELRETLRNGWRSLGVGLPILAVCLTVSQIIRAFGATQPFAQAAEESLILLGWVVNWTPLELLLYEWRPIARRRDLYRRLASAEVHIHFGEPKP
jgi:hypothetical protein